MGGGGDHLIVRTRKLDSEINSDLPARWLETGWGGSGELNAHTRESDTKHQLVYQATEATAYGFSHRFEYPKMASLTW